MAIARYIRSYITRRRRGAQNPDRAKPADTIHCNAGVYGMLGAFTMSRGAPMAGAISPSNPVSGGGKVALLDAIRDVHCQQGRARVVAYLYSLKFP